jgi:hypothetical protein
MSIRRKVAGLFTSIGVVATLVITGATSASAASNGTCSGGTVAAGSYESLTITGFCTLDGGNVTVRLNLKVASTGLFNALFGESTLTVGGNLIVEPGGVLALGCDPEELACFDNAAATSNHAVGRNLVVDHGLLVVVHDNHIGGNVRQVGGGAGFGCSAVFPNGPPDYTDYANNVIGGSASVSGLRTCWDGFSHNVVAGDVNHTDNQTAIDDGNLIDGNHIAGSLRCFDDTPAPHLSDGPTPIMNVVAGAAQGQCAAISV